MQKCHLTDIDMCNSGLSPDPLKLAILAALKWKEHSSMAIATLRLERQESEMYHVLAKPILNGLT